MFELPRLKNLCVEETRLLIKLKEQTKKEVQNILEKKKNLVDWIFKLEIRKSENLIATD